MNKILAFASIVGAIGIVLGAFGAHALQEILTPGRMQSFETAVRYQLFHVLIILVIVTCDAVFALAFFIVLYYSYFDSIH